MYVNRSEYPDIQVSKYGTATITGDIEELTLGVEYQITASEAPSKYGIGYSVLNIRRQQPTTQAQTKAFLYEILTPNQADVLYNAYPDIVTRVMEDRLDDIDLSKTKGIKEHTFRLIQQKIIANFKLAELVDEFGGLFSISVLKRLYEAYPSIAKIKEKLRYEPYDCLCHISGIGFKTADAMLLKIYDHSKRNQQQGKPPILHFQEDLRASASRLLAAATFLLEENEASGHTYIELRRFKRECSVLVPQASHHLLKVLHSDKIHFDKANMRVAKASTYATEAYLADTIKAAIARKPEPWQIDVHKYHTVDGCKLEANQFNTLSSVCTNAITVLCGYGGSGKSFSTKALIQMMDDNHISYQLMAPTGRASKVLSGYTGREATTIHRGLGYKPPSQWHFNPANPIKADVVIVDEWSMVDIFLCQRLLQAINFQHTRLLLIGDDAQIPSVGAGNILYDLLHSGVVPTITLDKIFRYGKGGLATAATDTRQGNAYLSQDVSGPQTLGADKSYAFLPLNQSSTVPNVVILYKKLLQDGYTPDDIAVLSCYNVGDYGTEALNKAIQRAINPRDDSVLLCGKTEFRIGDNVVQCVNDYQATPASVSNGAYTPNPQGDKTSIFNGEIGKVLHIEPKSALYVQFDNEVIQYKPGKLSQLKLAYSISTHKSQGGQFNVVVLVTPKAHTFMLTSNLLYVGISRAQQKCYHIGQAATINKAIKKKENFDRKTFLRELLQT